MQRTRQVIEAGSVVSAQHLPAQLYTADSHLGDRCPCAINQVSWPLPEDLRIRPKWDRQTALGLLSFSSPQPKAVKEGTAGQVTSRRVEISGASTAWARLD